MKRAVRLGGAGVLLAILVVSTTDAQAVARRAARPAAGGPNSVNLPYMQSDGMGGQWMVQGGGWVNMQGGQPVVSQGEMLTINGQQINNGNNSAQRDAKTDEIIIDMTYNQLAITRRLLFNKENGSIRYIDIFKNSQAQAQSVNVGWQTWTNYGVTTSNTVNDPKHSDKEIGWVAMTGINRAVVEICAGKNSKVTPSITTQNGQNNMVSFQLNIPGNKSVAIMHTLATSGTQDQGQQMVLTQNETKALASVPADIRKLIVNYPASAGMVGNYEMLRGDVLDVVELHTGDQYKGTLQAQSYKLSTFYGDIEVPTQQVIGLINVGEYRPRQLVVTTDGQIFGGQLQAPNIDLQLSSGQVIHIPLAEINRVGYRKRPNDQEEWHFDKPYILMRAGDRVEIEMPTSPIEVATRYGMLSLNPADISSILFQAEDSRVHEVQLSDGSKFAAVVASPYFEEKLAMSAPGSKPARFPSSAMVRLQIAGVPEDVDANSPVLTLLNEDSLVGGLVGTVNLDTAFDTLQINCPEIQKITHTSPGSPEVQVELWDNTAVSGQLEDPDLHCKLQNGVTMDVPVALLADYEQPLPMPAAPMVEKIKALVTDLSADDWQQRENAQSTLIQMGPAVLSVLRDLHATVPPEARTRMETIAKQVAPGFSFPTAPTTQPADSQ